MVIFVTLGNHLVLDDDLHLEEGVVGLNIVSKASLSGLTVIAMYHSTTVAHDDNLSRRKRRSVRSSSGVKAELF